jgi:ApaG protein
MTTQITDGVKVSVETVFQSEYSNPEMEHFMFAYKIRIENLTEYSVKLMRRYWYIFDSIGGVRTVEGDGVVGLQPSIAPGEAHEYVSGCHLRSDMGSMWGKYEMVREIDQELLEVAIPKFTLIAPYRLN